MSVPDPAKSKQKLQEAIEAMKKVQEAAKKVSKELRLPPSPQVSGRG